MGSRVCKAKDRVIGFVRANLYWIALTVAVLVGILVRLPGADFVSGDYYWYLMPWYEEIKLNGLAYQVGNYNLVYQFLIWLMTKLPIPSLYAYKILSCIFDYALAFMVGLVVYNLTGKKGRWQALTSFVAVLLSPVVVLNSSTWAQCDSIYVFFAVTALAFLIDDKYGRAMVFMGVALAFKLQAIFFLPAFGLTWLIKRRFSLLYFAIIPVAMILSGLPTAFFGRDLFDVVRIYLEQAGTYPYMALNYPSVWQLFVEEQYDVKMYELLKDPAIIITFAMLIAIVLFYAIRRTKARGDNVLMLTFITVYACVLLLPAMHERYSYGYEILAICIACIRPKTAPLCIGLHTVTLLSYWPFLYGQTPVSMDVLAILNIVIFLAYFAITYLYIRQNDRVEAHLETN